MECLEALTRRRGALRYAARPISRDLIEQVLAAAIAAPSPANLQPWAFVVVTNPELTRHTARYLKRVQEERVFQEFLGLPAEQTGRYMRLYDQFENTPCFILVCLDPKAHFVLPEHEKTLRDWYLMCLGAATANLMTAATALGLATRWFGGLSLDEDGQELKSLLRIPSGVEVAAVTPLGYAAEEATIRPRMAQSRAELASFQRANEPALAQMLRGKLPLEDVVHYEGWG